MLVYTLQCEAGEKGNGGGLKLRCDSDANDDEEEQQEEAISYTNTPSFAAREHASSLI